MKGTNGTYNQRKSFDLLIYADKFWRNYRLTQSATSNGEVATRNISNLKVSCTKFSHWAILPPNAWSFPTSHLPYFTPTHKLHSLHFPRCARYVRSAKEITKSLDSRLKSLWQFDFFFFPSSLFLDHVSLLITLFFAHRVFPWAIKNYLFQTWYFYVIV